MDPITTGAMLTGGAGIVGGLLGNEANAREAQKNRDFQERMSSTARQRDKADLEKAGLNPLLAAMGSGSSTPSGATATQEDVLGKGISSAIEARNLKLAIDKQEKELGLLDAQTGKTKMETKVLSTGIPEAELKNSIWDKVKKKAGDMSQNSAKDTQREREINQSPKMQETLQKIKLGAP